MQRRVLPMTILVVVLLVAIRWFGPDAHPEGPALAEAELTTYQPQLKLLAQSDLPEIVSAYQAGDSALAMEKVIEALDRDTALTASARAELTLTLANFNLRQGHPDLALTRLGAYQSFPEPRQQAEAQWWLAISSLAEDNSAAARRHLQGITSDQSLHRDQDANDLLARLRP